ncbi:MAG: FtsQ-type POTRA domain-containing protein [Nitrospiraceae bacterium]|nr:FtsQ-type POTRA domain-containing protein [Nitrospiraceae bacterium]
MPRTKDKAKGRAKPAVKRRFLDRPVVRALEAIVCAGLLGGVAFDFSAFALHSGFFNIDTIRVEGANVLREEDIIAQSGVTSGDCIFAVDAEEIRARVAEMPFVAECSVTRMFPRKVIIRLTERVAVATLLVNNHMYEIDANCHVLRQMPDAVAYPDRVGHVGPFISDVSDMAYVHVGQTIEQAGVRDAVAVWLAFRETSMAQEVTVSEVCAISDSLICMYVDELDCEIRWGRGSLAKQAWKLDVFWRSQNGRITYTEYVDLRFGDDVVCR